MALLSREGWKFSRVVAVWRLDLDHLGAKIAQALRSVGAGEDPCKIQDAKPFKRPTPFTGFICLSHHLNYEALLGSSTVPLPMTDSSPSWLLACWSMSTK